MHHLYVWVTILISGWLTIKAYASTPPSSGYATFAIIVLGGGGVYTIWKKKQADGVERLESIKTRYGSGSFMGSTVSKIKAFYWESVIYVSEK